MNSWSRGAVAVAAAIVALSATTTAAHGADQRKCVTAGEYNKIALGQWVTKDFDGDGDKESQVVGGTTYAEAQKILDGPGTGEQFSIESPVVRFSWKACGSDDKMMVDFAGKSFEQKKNKWRAWQKFWSTPS